MAKRELRIAIESIRIAIIVMAISVALAIIPLALDLINYPIIKEALRIIVIIAYCFVAGYLIHLARKIKSK